VNWCPRSGSSAVGYETDIVRCPLSAFRGIVLQKSKIERPRKSREDDFSTSLPLQSHAGPIRSSMVVLLVSDVGPHVSARETHQRA
jgi:hypothetical protein